jgi:hypothetical protein
MQRRESSTSIRYEKRGENLRGKNPFDYTTRKPGMDTAGCPTNSWTAIEPASIFREFVTSQTRNEFRLRPAERLLAQAKAFNNLAIPIRVAAVEIVQHSPALVDHHNQTAP